MRPFRCLLGRHLWRKVDRLTLGARTASRVCPRCGLVEYADE